MLLLLVLHYCCLEEVYSQTDFPYVSFRGGHLANHSYLDLTQVGTESKGQDSVICHTDLSGCCSNTEGSYRGDWFFPNGSRLQFDDLSVYESRGDRRVDLRRNSGGGSAVSGIYRCDIPINHQSSGSSMRATVYVGLYTSGGGIYFTNSYNPTHSCNYRPVFLVLSKVVITCVRCQHCV